MEPKKPLALLMNDIHVSKDNIDEFNLNWSEALITCKKYSIDIIIIGGDLWQSRSAQPLSTLLAVKHAIDLCVKAGIKLVIAEGNHCKVDQDSIYGYSSIFAGYKETKVIGDYEILIYDNVALYIMSYFKESGSFEAVYEDMIEDGLDNNRYNVLYIHEGIRGGLYNPTEDELPAMMFSDFDKVLVGHYHDRKKIEGTNIEYIGASRQHNFGEDEMKGYTILYSDGSHEFIQNQVNIRYKTIKANAGDINDSFKETIQEIKSDNRNRVKLQLTCSSAEASTIDKQKLIEAGISKVEVVTEQTIDLNAEHANISQKFDKTGIKQEYSDFCISKEIQDVELGLSYLDKINN